MFRAGFVTWLFLLLLLKLGALNVHLGFVVGCHEAEREALLKFKQSFNDTHQLSSWKGKDCCLWEGVGCDNVTSYVNRLDLHVPSCDFDWSWSMISAKLDRSLVELSRLNYLELSCIDFQGSQIPGFIGSFKHLRYLNLSNSNFVGVVPSQLGNLTRLHTLDLSTPFSDSLSSDLNWVSRLVSLRHLNMNNVYIYRSMNSTRMLNMPPLLGSLQLSNCQLNVPTFTSLFSNFTCISTIQQVDLSYNNLEGSLPIVFVNMTSLRYLGLSGNQISGSILYWLKNMRKLQHLDLSSNLLEGPFPRVFANVTSLRYLSLSQNKFTSSPLWLRNMKKLKYLDLSSNRLEGPRPRVFANMTSLTYLDLLSNRLEGPLPRVFANMTSLTYLDLSQNSFSGSIPPCIQNMEKLQYLDFGDNNFSQVEGGAIMGILGNLCKLKSFDLSFNSIGGEIGAHHNLSKCVTYDLEDLNLSHNMIGGTLPTWLGDFKSLKILNIGNNAIEGPIPVSIGSLSYLEELVINDNRMNGTIPQGLGQCKALVQIGLSSNKLQGVVSESLFANLSSLNYLDLGSNSLEVSLHSNWTPPFQLFQLSLSSCKMQMQFPRWIGKQTKLDMLDLSDNMLSGEVDLLFQLEYLEYVNISHNLLTGPVPYFSSSSWLNSIDLSYNLLSGPLVHSNAKNDSVGVFVCHLPSLEFLDLQGNNIFGTIPDCWNYSNDLAYINLSSNNLSGIIPMTMGQATTLLFLKLSNNSLQGPIPPTLSSSSSLQIIDLSENKLVGKIPIAWNGKTPFGLEILRLRGNQLEGAIPLSLCFTSLTSPTTT
ncbi:hypothetical protein RND81_12G140700 [Saponaria officinalis]|uniref:Leucine-rich repeat-containing N-terminal plant-type domain-containing protein n=1 Tax=Saponaria officinalis TaxID=3572 RepID=A0AAW1HAF2_SAPOF